MAELSHYNSTSIYCKSSVDTMNPQLVCARSRRSWQEAENAWQLQTKVKNGQRLAVEQLDVFAVYVDVLAGLMALCILHSSLK